MKWTQTNFLMAESVKPVKVIKYFIRRDYGTDREIVHPDSAGDGQNIMRLTGKATLTKDIRQAVFNLTGGLVTFEQVLPPN